MKTLTSLVRIALGLLALMFTVSVARADGMAPKDNEGKVSPEMLAKYDVNKDGKLDAKETAAMRSDLNREREEKVAMLAKYDKNKDGKLDDKEKAAMKADQDALKEAKKPGKHN